MWIFLDVSWFQAASIFRHITFLLRQLRLCGFFYDTRGKRSEPSGIKIANSRRMYFMEQTYMKEKPILPLLLSMALPMVLSMMVNSLYNIIDSYFVAKINENAMTALSLVFPVQNLITAVGVGFGIGINATIAYFLGAQKQEKADTSATLGVACSFLHGVLLTIGTIAIMPTFLSMFTKDQEVLSMGITYSRITFGFSIIISLGIAYEKIFQSVGRMKTTMFCMMSGCILNIILDPIMIFGLGPVPRMGIRGAA